MELNLKREWYLAQADREGTREIGAGNLEVQPTELVREKEVNYSAASTGTASPAFALLIRLKRLEHRWTFEKLAHEADVELAELLSIDRDNVTPRPRTVIQLASALQLPATALKKLSGLTRPDPVFQEQALQFAARSESMHDLRPEEKAALASFIAFLRGHPD